MRRERYPTATWRALAIGLVMSGSGGSPGSAADLTTVTFDLSLDSAAAGTLVLDAPEGAADTGGDYRLQALLDLAATPGAEIAATAEGTREDGRLVPLRFVTSGPLWGDADVTFSGGVPFVAVDGPLAHPHWIANPSALKGAVDPLAAFWSLARDVPLAEACRLRVFLYDGRHLSQVVLYVPEVSEGTVVCQGEYRRLNGYPPEEMTQKQRFAFFLTYRDAGAGMVRLTDVQFETAAGFGRLKRR